MKLYWHVGRIHNELKAAGLDQDQLLRVSDLSPFDQYHYHGTEAVDAAIDLIGINSQSRVIDVGSGIGGPARYIAAKTGCSVTALELQPELDQLGRDLTKRCGLSGQVEHICGDVLDSPLASGAFDGIVSWLAFYHIPNHEKLLSKLAGALKHDGWLYVEDLCRRGTLSSQEQKSLSDDLYSQRLLTFDEYRTELNESGFGEVLIRDMSDDWAQFTSERQIEWSNEREYHLEVQGPEIVQALSDFYRVVESLFQGRNLGGLCITARNRKKQ